MDKTNGNNLAGFKAALKKSGVEYATDEEYREAFNNLVGYFDILIQMNQAQQTTKQPPGEDDPKRTGAE